MPLFDSTYGFLKSLHPFMAGATFTLNLMAALLFLRFYRRTRDRLFLFFSAAFAIMGLNRVVLTIFYASNEASATLPYLIRLASFVLIIYAVIDKNRRPARL